MQTEDERRENAGNGDLEPEKRALSSYARYTGVAFQMMAIIGVSAFLGYKVDEYYQHPKPWVTAIACVLGVSVSIYQVIRQLKK